MNYLVKSGSLIDLSADSDSDDVVVIIPTSKKTKASSNTNGSRKRKRSINDDLIYALAVASEESESLWQSTESSSSSGMTKSDEEIAKLLQASDRMISSDEEIAKALQASDQLALEDTDAILALLSVEKPDTSSDALLAVALEEDERHRKSHKTSSFHSSSSRSHSHWHSSLSHSPHSHYQSHSSHSSSSSSSSSSHNETNPSSGDAIYAQQLYLDQLKKSSTAGSKGGKGDKSSHQSDADAIVDMIAEDARRAKRAQAPPPNAEKNLGSLANFKHNVHDAAVEGVAIKTVEDLLRRPLPPRMTRTSMIQELEQQLSRRELTRRPVELNYVAQQSALRILLNPHYLAATCKKSGRVFRDVLVAIYNVARSHKDRDEILRRMAEEMHEGDGECATGRVGRMVNALRGFVDIGGQDVEQVLRLTMTLRG